MEQELVDDNDKGAMVENLLFSDKRTDGRWLLLKVGGIGIEVRADI